MKETTGFSGPPAEAELRIVRLARNGEGVAEDGRRVPYTLPGERVRCGAADGGLRLVAVPEPSPERVGPLCRHFGRCGGCALQHASDGFLAEWKAAVVRHALAARGLAAPVTTVHVSPPGARRRVVFAGRRTRKGALVGFRERRGHTIVAVEDCPVARPELVAARPVLGALAGLGASRSGSVRLAVTSSEAGLDVAVDEARPLDVPLRHRLTALAAEHDLARLAWNGDVVAVRRPPWQAFGRARVVPPPGGFLQATAAGAAALAGAARDAVGGARRVVDLFAGSGTIALPLAEAAEVHAVEADPDALAALDAGWRAASGLRRVTTEARGLFRRPLHATELARFEAAVVDPPRAGAEAQMREIACSDLAVVTALSCSPSSFARDAEILVAAGFRLEWVRIVDLFRWSPHVELAAGLAR